MINVYMNCETAHQVRLDIKLGMTANPDTTLTLVSTAVCVMFIRAQCLKPFCNRKSWISPGNHSLFLFSFRSVLIEQDPCLIELDT